MEERGRGETDKRQRGRERWKGRQEEKDRRRECRKERGRGETNKRQIKREGRQRARKINQRYNMMFASKRMLQTLQEMRYMMLGVVHVIVP